MGIFRWFCWFPQGRFPEVRDGTARAVLRMDESQRSVHGSFGVQELDRLWTFSSSQMWEFQSANHRGEVILDRKRNVKQSTCEVIWEDMGLSRVQTMHEFAPFVCFVSPICLFGTHMVLSRYTPSKDLL